MINGSLVQGVSEPTQNIGLVAAWLAVAPVLALVRLLSERPLLGKRKEKLMNAGQKHDADRQPKAPRKFSQYIGETIWAAGAGVLGTSLATLS